MSYIALFIPTMESGGAERVFITLAHHFILQGHQVDIVLINMQGPLLKHCPPEINIVDLKAYKNILGPIGYISSTIIKLSHYLIKKKPDILLSTLTGCNLAATFAHKLSFSKSKLILREASSLCNVKNSLRLFLMRRIYVLANHIICLTETMKDALVQQIHINQKKISVIGNPIDIEKIKYKAEQNVPEIWSSKNTNFILAIGRLTQAKDYKSMLHAFSLAYQKNNKLRLVILGEGDQREELETLIKKLLIPKQVYMPGYEDNPYRWLSKAEVFILTSKWEGYPNVLIEAMALGIPLIATEYDNSVRTITQNYKQKTLVPTGDIKLISKAILDVHDIKIKTPYTIPIEDIIKQYLNVFEK